MRALMITLLLLAMSSSARAQCALSGEATIERVRIEPRGAAPFHLGVDGHAVTVTPLEGDRVRVESASTLLWSGTARARDVSVFLASDVRLAEGAITARVTASISKLRLPAGAAPIIDVELAEGVWIRGVSLPCEALALERSDEGASVLSPDGPERGDLLPRQAALRVYAHPGGASIHVELASPDALRLARMERRGEWLRVRRELDEASIDGWVRASSVRAVAPEPFTWTGGGLRGSGSGCGRGASHTYVGPATLLAGSELRTAVMDGTVWAVATADLEVRVMIRWGASWGEIETIDGLVLHGAECEERVEAWIPTRSLLSSSGAPFP